MLFRPSEIKTPVTGLCGEKGSISQHCGFYKVRVSFASGDLRMSKNKKTMEELLQSHQCLGPLQRHTDPVKQLMSNTLRAKPTPGSFIAVSTSKGLKPVVWLRIHKGTGRLTS